MAKLDKAYKAKKSDFVGGGGKPLNGEYVLIYNKDEKKENRNKSGSHLAVEFGFADKKLKKRKIWQHFNFWHESDEVSEIAVTEFENLLHCMGVDKLNKNSKALYGQKVVAEIESTETEFTKKQLKVFKKQNKKPPKFNTRIVEFKEVGEKKKKGKKSKNLPF